MPRTYLGTSTLDAALDRIIGCYEEGHKVVVSSSGGKDSAVTMELAIMAARVTGNLPVDVVTRDEEVMLPGTFEYMERVAQRPEVRMRWVIANQPIINVFNRAQPYWWTFDPLLPEDEWVRKPPFWLNDKLGYEAVRIIPEKSIEQISTQKVYPPPEGKKLVVLNGMRAAESTHRLMGVFSSRGWLNKNPNKWGSTLGKPIYDMSDGDVWRAIRENSWDYNDAYDVMYRMGMSPRELRIAPPTMMQAQWKTLDLARRAWPRWFNRVAKRCHGVRHVGTFGKWAVYPNRRSSELWSETFQRTCIDDAPAWIAERASRVREAIVAKHARHATSGLPENKSCERCGQVGSWRYLTQALYYGDPFTTLMGGYLNVIEPEFFRDGAGTWGGSASW